MSFPPGAPAGNYYYVDMPPTQNEAGEQQQAPPPGFYGAPPSGIPANMPYWPDPNQSPGMVDQRNPMPLQPMSSANPPNEPKKHRRTRSGCFTCRSRRVKCDEGRPTCERCKKGKRDCVYPVPGVKSGGRSNPKSGDASTAAQQSDSSDEEDAHPSSKGLETIPDDDEGEREGSVTSKQSQSSAKGKEKRPAESTLRKRATGGSPSIDHSAVASQPQSASPRAAQSKPTKTQRKLSSLKSDFQFYLKFHREHITHYNYFLHQHAKDFVETTLIDYALSYDPLLYAVVGFSAYHYTSQNPGGELPAFLKYYNRAVSSLRKSLQAGEEPSLPMLMTILELATFEEHVGNWVSLMDHQKAAYSLLLKMFTPESVMKTVELRCVFNWYSRLDIVAGLMGGTETFLNRDWDAAFLEFHKQDIAESPNDIDKHIPMMNVRYRVFGRDMAALYSKLPRGKIAFEDFVQENAKLAEDVDDMHQSILALSDPRYVVTSYPHAQPLGLDDIVNPYLPGGAWQGPLWALNVLLMDWYATAIMYKAQSALVMQQPVTEELENMALELCRILETMYRWPDKPEGIIINSQPAIGIASVFIPKDNRHMMWCRRRLALVEQSGFIFPPKFRSKLAEIWSTPEVNHWWLPDDEGFPSLAQEIRNWTEERTTNPRDETSGDVQEMKAIFGKMTLDDSSSKSSPSAVSGISAPQQEATPEESSNTWTGYIRPNSEDDIVTQGYDMPDGLGPIESGGNVEFPGDLKRPYFS